MNVDFQMSETLNNNLNNHNHNTRMREMLNLVNITKTRSKNNILHNGVKIWNSLPNELQDLNSYYRFKNKSKKYYHGRY